MKTDTPRTATAYKITDPDSATQQPGLQTMQVRKWRNGFKVYSASWPGAPRFIPISLRMAGACETPAQAWQWYIELQSCRESRAKEAQATAKHRMAQAVTALSALQPLP